MVSKSDNLALDGYNKARDIQKTDKSVMSTVRTKQKVHILAKDEGQFLATPVSSISLPNSVYMSYTIGTYFLSDGTTLTFNPWANLYGRIVSQVPNYGLYVRPVIKVYVNIVTVPAIYGHVIVNWYPVGVNLADTDYTNQDPYVIDLNEGGLYEIEIPYINTKNFIKFSDMALESPQILLEVTQASTDPSAGASALISMAIQDLGVRGVSQMGDVVRRGRYQNPFFAFPHAAQQATQAASALYGAYRVAAYAVKSADSTVKEIKQTIETGKNVVREVKDMVVGEQQEGEKLLNEPLVESIEEDEEPQPRHKEGPSTQAVENAQIKYIADNPLGTMTGSAINLENYNTRDYYANVHNIGDTGDCHKVLDILRLSQIAYTLKKTVRVGGVYGMTMPVNPTRNYYQWHDEENSQMGRSTHCNVMTQLFAYWRGGMNYKFNFYSSPYVSYLVTLSFTYKPVSTSLTTVAPVIPYYTKEVVVSGSSSVDFCIPFLNDTDWIPVGYSPNPLYRCPVLTLMNSISQTTGYASTPLGYMYLVVSNVRRTGNEDPEFICVVSAQAAPDFQVRHFYPRRFYPAVSQMRIRENTYEPDLIEGLPYGKKYNIEENEYSIEQLCRRWSIMYGNLGSPPYRHLHEDWFTSGGTSIVQYNQIPTDIYLPSMFYFVRGSWEFKMKANTVNSSRYPDIQFMTSILPEYIDATMQPNSQQPLINNGAVVRSIPNNRIVDGSFSMEGQTEWFPTAKPVVYTDTFNVYFNVDPDDKVTLYSRGGLDLQLALLGPPFNFPYWPLYLAADAN